MEGRFAYAVQSRVECTIVEFSFLLSNESKPYAPKNPDENHLACTVTISLVQASGTGHRLEPNEGCLTIPGLKITADAVTLSVKLETGI